MILNLKNKNIVNYIIYLFPILLITGPALPDLSLAIIDTTYNGQNFETSQIQLSWDQPEGCSGNTEWNYNICLQSNGQCISTDENEMIIDIGWNAEESFSVFVYGCAIDLNNELVGSEFSDSISTNDRPSPTIPGDLIIVENDNNGQGYIEL